jgi:hypothetical protein
MKRFILLILAVVGCQEFSGRAAPLAESAFTEIINQVSTLTPDGAAAPAKLTEVLQAPERVRTGPQSRAELTAPDRTITRVGANTVFSYADQGRTLNLEQGSLLFHAPKGLGGGTIRSGGAAAAVLGTTLIVSATAEGGFKVILLEGRGRVTLPNGVSVRLTAGQLVFVLPGGTRFSHVLVINLGKLAGGSQLVNGFPDQLSSLPLILAAIHAQNARIATGGLTDTGLPADAFLNPPVPGNGLNALDHGTYQNAVPAPISQSQYFTLFYMSQRPGSAPGSTGGRGTTPVQAFFPSD